MHYKSRLIAFGVAAALCVACSDTSLDLPPGASPPTDSPPGSDPPATQPITLPALVISEPVGLLAQGTATAAAAESGWVYVSHPPGSLGALVSVRIRNLTSGTAATEAYPIVDGGFDPIAVQAVEGDELELELASPTGETTFARTVVPGSRPPTVLRTSPPPGRADVSLGVVPQVILSEPVDPASITATTVYLLRGDAHVDGVVRVNADRGWTVELQPAASLEPATNYVLVVTTDVRDLSGDAVPEEVRVTFRTAPPGQQDGAGTANILVTAATTGSPIDTDGYQVTVTGNVVRTARLQPNDRVHFVSSQLTGDVTVQLTDVAAGCVVAGGATRHVSIVGGAEVQLDFDVDCPFPPEIAAQRIVFARSVDEADTQVIWSMNADGTGATALAEAPCCVSELLASPSGARIAFAAGVPPGPWGSDLHVVQVDGPIVTLSSPGAGRPLHRLRWSPDGSRIAFTAGDPWVTWPAHAFVVNADGSGLTQVTSDAGRPGSWVSSWSPDGTRLLVELWQDYGNPDGAGIVDVASGDRQVLAGDVLRPVWSPDGSTIVYLANGAIWAVSPDGSSPQVLATGDARHVSWSPDSRIRFVLAGPTGTTVSVMDPDGSNPVHLGTLPAGTWQIDDWTPDGRLIAISGRFLGESGSDVHLFDTVRRELIRITRDRHSAPAAFLR